MAEPDKKSRWRLGEILVQHGWVTWENLEKALTIQRELENQAKPQIGTDYMMGRSPSQMLSLGEILVRHGWMTWPQLEEAIEVQKRRGGLLGDLCVQMGFVTSKDCYRGIAIQQNMAFIDFEKIVVDPQAVKLIPRTVADDLGIMPAAKKDSAILVAVSNPSSIKAESELQALLPDYKIHVGIACPDEIRKAIRNCYT